MNHPALAGLVAGVVLSLLGLAVVWPALGRGLLPVLGRLTAVFLGKLVFIVVLVLWVQSHNPSHTVPYAVALAATVVVLLLAQAGLLVWRLGRLEAGKRAPAEGADARGEA